jgi:acetyltransferase-like isoleucine patch superfamily enzyme
MLMRWIGPVLGRLKIGRFRDWYRFTWAKLRSPGTIEAAALPMIDPPFRLRMAPGTTLVIGRDVRFYSGFHLYMEEGSSLEIGDRNVFNVNCWIGVVNRLTIGSDNLFAPLVTITDGNHNFGPGAPFWQQGFEPRDVSLGSNVWIGAKATVINSVGNDSVVGANAVVSRPVPNNTLAMGMPARAVRAISGPDDMQHARVEAQTPTAG